MALTKSGEAAVGGEHSVDATCAKNLNGPQTNELNIPESHPFIWNLKTFLREEAEGFKQTDFWRAVADGKCGLV